MGGCRLGGICALLLLLLVHSPAAGGGGFANEGHGSKGREGREGKGSEGKAGFHFQCCFAVYSTHCGCMPRHGL